LSATLTIAAQTPLPYVPSWVDRLLRALQRLPISYWFTYLLIAALESLLVHGAAWLDGTTPVWTVQPIFLMFPLRTWISLALITFLNQQAIEALHQFRPLLDSDDEERHLAQQMTTMPMRPVVVVNLLGCLYFLFLAINSPLEAYKDRPLLTPAYLTSGFLAFGLGSVIYYHTYRQLRFVHRIYAGVHSFNLFQLEPVYAFSRLTALTGGAYLLLITLTLLLFPFPVTDRRAILSFLLQMTLTLVALILPLWNTHQRLAREKRRLQSAVDRRIETTLGEMHRHIDKFEAQSLEGHKTALESLLLERKVLEGLPTWPWQSSTLHSFLTAVFVPLFLFVVQLVLERWFSP
jgi:hypothetical protein